MERKTLFWPKVFRGHGHHRHVEGRLHVGVLQVGHGLRVEELIKKQQAEEGHASVCALFFLYFDGTSSDSREGVAFPPHIYPSESSSPSSPVTERECGKSVESLEQMKASIGPFITNIVVIDNMSASKYFHSAF